MGCGSCSTGACSATKGCNNKGGCATGGCNKLNTFDWLGNMTGPGEAESDNVYEVRFKNTRKQFFRNVNGLDIITGDFVAVESDRGFDVGQVSLGGVLARLQMKKKEVRPDKPGVVRKIYRHATREDMDRLSAARAREQDAIMRTRKIVKDLRLRMKLSDVEFQGDNTKAIFYYIADQRVDFRQLIKILASEFHVRVEMKQIGLRHEAGLVGSIGSCGRELCCSTWLTDFKSVGTAAARYQNLSLNPMKISGQCGRLKCCLNYELDTYMDALRYIPDIRVIDTEQGRATLQKTDIFKRVMWFAYENETTWIAIEVDKVRAMRAHNDKGMRVVSLHSIDGTDVPAADTPVDFVDVVGQAKPREDRRGKKKNKSRRPGEQRQGPNGPQDQTPGNEFSGSDNEGSEQQPPVREQRPQRENRQQNRPPRREGGPENPEGQGEGGQQQRRDNRDNRDRRNRDNNRNRPPRDQRPQNRQQNRPPRTEGGPENPEARGEGGQQQRRENRDNRNPRDHRNRDNRNRPPRDQQPRNEKPPGNDAPPPPPPAGE